MSEDTRSAQVLDAAWRRSDELFALLGPRAWEQRAIPLRHPPIFYLGHLAAFAWNQAAVGLLGKKPFHPSFDVLFERGIDPADADEAATHAHESWPPMAEILAYRDGVRRALGELDGKIAKSRDALAEADRVWHLIREHEEMHHETLLYLFHELDPAHLRRPRHWPRVRTGSASRPSRWMPVKAGPATLGTSLAERTFAWDNEMPRHEVEVAAFELQELPVTNERYRAFIQDGGYRKRAWWTDATWDWKKAAGLKHPQSWRKEGKIYEIRSLFAWHPIEDVGAWPVLVTQFEAEAFARWSQARLPTEAEMARAAYTGRDGQVRAYPWGDEYVPGAANLAHATGGLEPVGQRRNGAGPWGHLELVGNAWEWTSTPFGPFEGFEAWHHTYPGYSADFFDGRHGVVFGASWATSIGLARRSFRNWYLGHYPYAFAGFRLARG